MATPKKIATVEKLAEKIARAKTLVLADYRGLKHKQLEQLRKLLKKVNGELVVAKNRLLLRALGEKGQELQETLKQTTAALFAYEDEVAPLKEMLKFFKAAGVGKTKAGLLGTQLISDTEVTRLAQLPTHAVLLGGLARGLNAPLQGLHYALSWNIRKLAYALNAIKANKS